MSTHVRVFSFAATFFAFAFAFGLPHTANAQPANPQAEPPPLPPSNDPLSEPPAAPVEPVAPAEPVAPTEPAVQPRVPNEERRREREREPEPEEEMSEGRRIVVAYNTGFQWGIAPGVVFDHGDASFFLGLRFGYGIDTGKVIVVPGVRLAGYFTDPNVYLGMPVMKLVYPIDRFAPFVEGGAGVGYVAGYDVDLRTSVDPKTGLALMVGGGFMLHFSWKFGLGVEANYQVVTGTDFRGFGIGPILAIAF